MGVTYFLLLSSLGLAITTQALDCPRPVGGDNMGLKGEHILSQSFPNGTVVSFECNVGYQSAGGSPFITCSNGTWSPLRLKCERRSCGTAGEVSNGQVDYPEGVEFGAKLVVTCNSGYTLVGKSEILCGAQGWLSRLPKCEVVTCKPPPTVTDGTFDPVKESYGYMEVVQYSCRKDYTLSGSKSLSCSDNGMFTPAPPACLMVQCEDPDIKNAYFVSGSRPPHKYKSTVTFACSLGYTMIGAGTQTCGINSQWSPGLPECQKMITTTKPTTTSTTTTTTTTTRSSSTKKPTDVPDPTDPPGNNGNGKAIGLGIGLSVLGILLAICGCYFCGVPARIKAKRRSRRDFLDNVAPKHGEDVALS